MESYAGGTHPADIPRSADVGGSTPAKIFPSPQFKARVLRGGPDAVPDQADNTR
jgi:hypothetical protein